MPSWVFICGQARSGTTLLSRLLDGHPSCAVLPWDTRVQQEIMSRRLTRWVLRTAALLDRPEVVAGLAAPGARRLAFRGRPALRDRLTRWLQDFPRTSPDAWLAAASAATEAAPPAGFWEAFFPVLAVATEDASLLERPVRVEKTPANERLVPLLDRLFGASTRYVHVVRDPRSVVASWMALHRPTGERRPRALVDRCVDWSRSVALACHHDRARPGRYLLLRYEDLVTDTERTMTAVLAFLRLPPHARRTMPTHLGEPAPPNSSFQGLAEPGRVVAPGERRRQDTILSDESALVEALLCEQMRACGYPVGRTTPPASALGGVRHRLRLWELRRRQTRARDLRLFPPRAP